MAWNEPDNDDRKDDPWGNRPGEMTRDLRTLKK